MREGRFAIACCRLPLIAAVAVLLLLPSPSHSQVRIEPPRPKPTPTPAPAPRRPASVRVRGPEFIAIPPGEFVMGSGTGGDAGLDNERPPHPVRITRAFEMGKYEVTQRQWKEVMSDNPSYFTGDDRPVDNVTWEGAQEFIRRMNERNDGFIYRLPTEAEWEYACRAGAMAESAEDLNLFAWYDTNSGERSKPVGTKKANAWGLHDMLGNVAEWVMDWYDAKYYQQSPADDPPGPATGTARVNRGCSALDPVEDCRASARRSLLPDKGSEGIGFRLVRMPRQ